MENSDKIKTVTKTGQILNVVVTSFSAEAIWNRL